MKFEEKLMALRKKNGMSQEDLAEQLGVSRQAVSRWELGATLPDAPNLLKLSDIFGVTVDYLLRDECEGEGDVPPTKKVCCETSASTKKNHKLYLVATVSFLIAAVAFLIAAIERMNIYLVLLVFADAILASVFFWKYCKTKE